MTFGDKLFYSVMALIFIGLFWLKFVERYLNIWFCLVPWLVVSALIFNPKLVDRWWKHGRRGAERTSQAVRRSG